MRLGDGEDHIQTPLMRCGTIRTIGAFAIAWIKLYLHWFTYNHPDRLDRPNRPKKSRQSRRSGRLYGNQAL